MKLGAITAAVFSMAAITATLGGAEHDIWKDAESVRLLGSERVARADFREGIPLLQTAAELNRQSPVAAAALANAFHLQRRLDEAAVQYLRLLQLVPASEPRPEEREAILRFAPRVFQCPSDPFPLKDVVAVHHPAERLIAYHLFWEDDIDFPEDNDPCDHEVVWVRYKGTKAAGVYTYFHGRLLQCEKAAKALQDAHENAERARINVQWGKHGSLPFGWEQLQIQANAGDVENEHLDLVKPVSLEDYNRATWLKLHTVGRRMAEHPLGRAWPNRFTGSWDDFVTFSREIDIRPVLQKRSAMVTARWNNAVLQQQFLPYNFRPKTEWPEDFDRDAVLAAGLRLRESAAPPTDPLHAALDLPGSLPGDLPPASLFQPETPRYPNVWYYAPERTFKTYEAFVDWLENRFRQEGFSPEAVSLNEGADIALSIEHLQPWNSVSKLAHAHSLHIRFFWKRLVRDGLEKVRFGREGEFNWRVAASVHYEVDHYSPFHADVEICPFCGRTGGHYAVKEGSLVERVHDPLGLELVLWGTVKGERIRPAAKDDFVVARPNRADMNTEAIAIVTLK